MRKILLRLLITILFNPVPLFADAQAFQESRTVDNPAAPAAFASQPAPGSAQEQYANRKLDIRTMDIYHSYWAGFDPDYYNHVFGPIAGSRFAETAAFAHQAWAITQGGVDISDLEFMKLVDPERASRIQGEIGQKMVQDQTAQTVASVAGLAGLVGLVAGSIPMDSVSDSAPFQDHTHPAYGTKNIVFLSVGAFLALTSLIVGGQSAMELAALQRSEGDTFFHFNTVDYTRRKIADYNDGLRAELKIKF